MKEKILGVWAYDMEVAMPYRIYPYRRPALYGQIKKDIGQILWKL